MCVFLLETVCEEQSSTGSSFLYVTSEQLLVKRSLESLMVQTGEGEVQTQNDTAKFTAGKAECGAVATCRSEVECSA